MTPVPAPFVSYAQNGEDVVLWRALRSVGEGRYVDVGANSPEQDSVTKAFYDRGWSGLDVEPMAECAQQLRAARPRDVVAEVAVTGTDGGEVVLHEFAGTGLSTLREEYVADAAAAGFAEREVRVPTRRLDSLVAEHLGGEQVHFCKIDVEGAEAEVLGSVDLASWRPWVLVVEATRPNSAEPTHTAWEDAVLAAGYRFCLFDGLSRFYVSPEHLELAPALSYPACPLDDYTLAATAAVCDELDRLRQVHHETVVEVDRLREREELIPGLEAEVAVLRSDLVRWRGAVLERWAAAVAPPRDDRAQAELDAIRQTVSWRVTRPLRAVRSRQIRSGS